MKWKIIKAIVDGKEVEVCVVSNGMPVSLNAAGTDEPIDLTAIRTAHATELATERTAHAATAAGFEPFKGMDAAKAKAALQTVKTLGDQDLLAAGKLDDMRAKWTADLTTAHATEVAGLKTQLAAVEGKANALNIRTAFQGSKLIGGETAGSIRLPAGKVEAIYGRHFRTEQDGSVAAYHDPGEWKKPILGADGKPAAFDDSLAALVKADPDAVSFTVAASQARGSGNQPSGAAAQGGGTKSKITNAQLQAMPVADHAAFFAGGGEVAG